MRRLATIAILAALLGGVAGPAAAGTIEPNLQAILSRAGDQEVVSALVYLSDRVDVDALTEQLNQERATLRQQHEVVVTSLRERATATQGALLAELDALAAQGTVKDFRAFWITNCIRVDATPAAIKAIAGRADVETVYLNYPIELIEPVSTGSSSAPPHDDRNPDPEPGITAVRAPEAWALGFTGQGVLVATLDTGVDGNHEALASRWRGVADPRYADHPEWAWFDPVTNTTFPQDFWWHGTHTMGTVCGGPPGDEIGVAPGAQWISAGVIDRVSLEQTIADAMAAFEWMVDPDGDPTTNWDVPAVCSNSWGIATYHNVPPYSTPCDESFWSYLDACEAAGTVILFSAGNEGSSGLRRPADRATDDYRTCAVAAVNGNVPSWPIADFSSRGPTYCTPNGDPAIKPDIAAPGVQVRSAVPYSPWYDYSDGTSMASPHVNGAVALVREACPDLNVEEVKQVIYETAYDLGAAGEDNDYGWGMLDCYAAVELALSLCSGAPRARDGYYETPVDAPVLVTLEATDYDGLPDPPGALVYRIVALPEEPGNTLTDAGNDHVILPEELPYELVDGGNEVLFSPSEGYYGYQTFQFLANDGGEPPDAGDSNIATITVLVLFGPPVIITESLPPGLVNGIYGPVALEAEGGQPELTWDVLPASEYYETDLGSSLFSEVGSAQGWHADDQAWSYTLPFTFPFFGAEYTSCYICSNGFINFGSSDSDYSNSDTELIAATRIAPLWDDLRTDGTGNDIFIDESVPGQVTIRWDVVTYSGGYACNFSATLFEDGRIQFHYGSGNTGLSPTIGMSAGDGVRYTLASYNNAGSLTDANSLEFVMPSTLPEGLALSPEGELSGIPTELGVFTPTFRVTDSLGRSDQRELAIEINSGPVPPIAQDQDVSTPANVPLTITLAADDDGLPDPPAAVTYIIESLPASGTLSDPGAGVIDTVPYTLVDGGNQVVYTPDWWYIGADSFTFKANDGGVPPDGGDSNVATVSIEVVLPEVEQIYSFPLDSDPGWATEDQWAFGQPAGNGSHHGDPTAGHTGDNVYGYDLGIDDEGDYEFNMPARYLTTSAINCSALLGVELRFWRWLGVEQSPYDYATVEVSADGSNWTPVWTNPTSNIDESSWSQMVLDISSVANREPTVYVRWGMGPTNDRVTYPGWNVDDVEIWGVVTGPRCPGDLDGDGDVDLTDLSILLGNYGMTSGALYEDGDMDGDGDVDLTDLSLLLAHYGETCP